MRMRASVVLAYAIPALVVWGLLGLGVGALGLVTPGLRGMALAAAAAYGCYYGLAELSGRRGLAPPGREWQVPQAMLIRARPRRRLLVWGALLGPGFATMNPFAGFGMLPLAVTAMPGIGAAVVVGAGIGLAHGTARASALLRDARDLSASPAEREPGGGPPTHLDMLLKAIYWRRFDGAALLTAAATGAVACLRYFT